MSDEDTYQQFPRKEKLPPVRASQARYLHWALALGSGAVEAIP